MHAVTLNLDFNSISYETNRNLYFRVLMKKGRSRSRSRSNSQDKNSNNNSSGGKEHTKNARPSTEQKHEKGQSRKGADRKGGEKGDARRPY